MELIDAYIHNPNNRYQSSSGPFMEQGYTHDCLPSTLPFTLPTLSTLHTAVDEAMPRTSLESDFILLHCILVTPQLITICPSFLLKVPREQSCNMILAHLRMAAPTLGSPNYSMSIHRPPFTLLPPLEHSLLQENAMIDVVDTTTTVGSQFQSAGAARAGVEPARAPVDAIIRVTGDGGAS